MRVGAGGAEVVGEFKKPDLYSYLNSFRLKDCFYTEARRDRLDETPATTQLRLARCQLLTI